MCKLFSVILLLLLAMPYAVAETEPEEVLIEIPLSNDNGHNIIPYFPDLLIQKENYENSQYLFAGLVKIGKLADANRSSGNVVFKAGSDITIGASGDVLLGSRVIVKSGTSLTVKSRETVTIADCVVKSEGSLTVESNETSIAPSFEAESGAVINIKPLSNKNLRLMKRILLMITLSVVASTSMFYGVFVSEVGNALAWEIKKIIIFAV